MVQFVTTLGWTSGRRTWPAKKKRWTRPSERVLMPKCLGPAETCEEHWFWSHHLPDLVTWGFWWINLYLDGAVNQPIESHGMMAHHAKGAAEACIKGLQLSQWATEYGTLDRLRSPAKLYKVPGTCFRRLSLEVPQSLIPLKILKSRKSQLCAFQR